MYSKKYIKYKNKYFNLKQQKGGMLRLSSILNKLSYKEEQKPIKIKLENEEKYRMYIYNNENTDPIMFILDHLKLLNKNNKDTQFYIGNEDQDKSTIRSIGKFKNESFVSMGNGAYGNVITYYLHFCNEKNEEQKIAYYYSDPMNNIIKQIDNEDNICDLFYYE